MNRSVYTYTDLLKIKDSSFYESIKNCPQITATNELRRGINRYSKTHKGERLFEREVRDFEEVLEKVCPNWKSATEVFAQTVTVSEFLRGRIANAPSQEEEKYYRGFKRNTSQIVKMVNSLEELSVSCDDLRRVGSHNKDMLVFCDAWEYLYNKNGAIREFREALRKLEEKRKIDLLIKGLFGDNAGDTIVVHGFYYVTGIQERVFRLLEHAGYRLIFLSQYHLNYPMAMEAWDVAYEEGKGYDAKEDWVITGKQISNVVGELLEGRIPKIDSKKIKIIRYRTAIEFAQHMKKVKERGEIYSSNATQANQILKEIYPEKYGERKLLSYPIGQFLVALHSMWDEEKADVILNESLLRECFASNWLSIDGKTSATYLRDLELVLPYFEKCLSYLDWEERIEQFREVYKEVVQPFFDNVAEINNVHVAETSGNPFTKIGAFSVEADRLSAILDIIGKLISIAKELFLNTRFTSVSSHMAKLEEFISGEVDFSGKEDDEILVVHELIKSISNLKINNMPCYVDDIVTAMHLYLNRTDDEEIIASGIGMVYSLTMIDAATIKDNKCIHICMCDMDNMPGSVKAYEWPLDLRSVENYVSDVKNPFFDLYMENHKMVATYNRYCFFSACNNPEVEFSWINMINQKENSPSPYIDLLELGGLDLQTMFKKSLEKKTIEETVPHEKMLKCPEDMCCDSGIKDIKMEYATCSLRYLYGYVLDAFPKFANSFQISRVSGGLIMALVKLMDKYGCDKKYIADQVFELFPQLRQIEKQQIFDYTSKDIFVESIADECDGYEFAAERFLVSYPDAELLELVREKYSELGSQLSRKGIDLYNPTDLKKACVFCPHEAYCPNCIHAIDQEEYYE